MHRIRTFPILLFFAAIATPAWAQNTVIQVENVRTEYAQVLRVEPVYQTLRATSVAENCQPTMATDEAQAEESRRGIARVVGAVKDALTPGTDDKKKAAAAAKAGDCEAVAVSREFRRPIAYDVDYVHHGIKYRSRLPFDPGNRIRVRVSVMPVVLGAGAR